MDVVVSFEHDDIQLSIPRADGPGAIGSRLGEAEVLLARDVLDTQIVDVVGKRLA